MLHRKEPLVSKAIGQAPADNAPRIEEVLKGQDVAVLIPCYNEEITITKVVADFRAVLPLARIYVYDNNSSDDTARLAAEAGAIVAHEPRQGKGNVVRQMFREIEARYYLMVDGDDTYPAESAPELLRPLAQDEADMTVGDRISNGSYQKENERPFHGFGNNLVRWMIRRMYGYGFEDVMTGYRAMNRAFVKTVPIVSEGFQIETEISIHAVDKRWRVCDVPIAYRDRPEGSQSKLSTVGDGILVLRAIASLFKDYKPLAFFGLLALLFVALGLVAGVPVIAEYFDTGRVERLPSAVLAVAFVLCGALSFTAGLILDTVAKSTRKLWELNVYAAYETERLLER
ncbi:glycosyltransferase [Parvibacter caecicola]|uniref:Glycosyltransferase n=1 Tax=Parvibacter caecicola TaxID=747645 RepID=A0A4T9TG84_9ACTN|nr:glycosyltransferase [Parvibacter caecicola]